MIINSLEDQPQNLIEELSPTTTQDLIVYNNRTGLRVENPDDRILRKCGGNVSNIIQQHQNNTLANIRPEEDCILGITETSRRTFIINVNGEMINVISATPLVRNIWVGENVRLLTLEETKIYSFAREVIESFAKKNGKLPEMIVCARNGRFYPASSSDEVIKEKIV